MRVVNVSLADRQRIAGLLVAVFAVAVLMLVMATPSEALKRRPTVSKAHDCIADAGDGSDTSCEGAICSCCYSDGCWICNAEYKDCVWDPGRQGRKPAPGVVKPPVLPGVVEPSKPAPKSSPVSKPGISAPTLKPGLEAAPAPAPSKQTGESSGALK
jgi:hypothetical protein